MISGRKKDLAVVSACLVVGMFVGQHFLKTSQSPPLVTSRRDTWKSIFDEPLSPDTTDCLRLFDKPESDKDFFTATYLQQRRRFEANLKRISDGEKEKGNKDTHVGGSSGGAKHQSRLYHWLAGRPWVNTICETGFNAGHSTLQWLTGSDHTKVYSFDIASHYYTRPMADYINRTFPGRFHLTIGDSLQTVPRFAASRRDVKCDVIVVDGGHSHDVALGDLRNFRDLANIERNVLVVDDKDIHGIKLAWKETLTAGLAAERFACNDGSRWSRAYAIGYYV